MERYARRIRVRAAILVRDHRRHGRLGRRLSSRYAADRRVHARASSRTSSRAPSRLVGRRAPSRTSSAMPRTIARARTAGSATRVDTLPRSMRHARRTRHAPTSKQRRRVADPGSQPNTPEREPLVRTSQYASRIDVSSSGHPPADRPMHGGVRYSAINAQGLELDGPDPRARPRRGARAAARPRPARATCSKSCPRAARTPSAPSSRRSSRSRCRSSRASSRR